MCLLLPGEHRSWLELSSSLWINHLIPKNGFTRGCCIQQTPDSPLLLSLLKQQAVIKERRSTRQQWTVELSVNPAWYHLSLYLVKRDMHNAGFFTWSIPWSSDHCTSTVTTQSDAVDVRVAEKLQRCCCLFACHTQHGHRALPGSKGNTAACFVS